MFEIKENYIINPVDIENNCHNLQYMQSYILQELMAKKYWRRSLAPGFMGTLIKSVGYKTLLNKIKVFQIPYMFRFVNKISIVCVLAAKYFLYSCNYYRCSKCSTV